MATISVPTVTSKKNPHQFYLLSVASRTYVYYIHTVWAPSQESAKDWLKSDFAMKTFPFAEMNRCISWK